MKEKEIKKIVKDRYKKIAVNSGSCNCGCGTNEMTVEQISKSIGYSNKEMEVIPEANLGLGCGNPTAFSKIQEGDIVLDLGSGAGFDCFLAAQKVGNSGKVIGVDMTEEMIEKSRGIAKKYEYDNVDFRLGDIDNLPVDDNSVDIVISNCVINLSPNKLKVYKEAYRVLKDNGKMYVSDIVLLEELTNEQRKNEELIAGCVGVALLKDDYLKIVSDSGFKYKILSEDKDISKEQYQGIPLESLKIELSK
ncbi:MAG: arsenite S-adenosylmethyltransferase [Thermoplasmata archaeon]|nr:MAG: arsenite S-adenosylmethyltransferase [Thermoplasmata archaeon]